jgi:hypothetical protein
MSVSGISSSSFMSQNIANIQNQQQQIQKQFQSLAQEFQSGSLSAEQTTAQPQSPLATGTLATPGGSSSLDGPSGPQSGSPQSHGHSHHHHRHFNVNGDPLYEATNTATFGQLGQPIQEANSPAAQQAYGVQQDLQQIALNSDLITAQSAALQASSLSVTA